jgi:hypothetical protein
MFVAHHDMAAGAVAGATGHGSATSGAIGREVPGMAALGEGPLSAIYTTDEFRIAAYKVLPCSQRSAHDW